MMKEIERKLDTLRSKLIRQKGYCEYCGTTKNLEAHHIFGRSRKSVRRDLDNGICLCREHHTQSSVFSAHLNIKDFESWLKLHKPNYEELKIKANKTKNRKQRELEELYEKLLLKLNK